MHEFSIATSIITIVQDEMLKYNKSIIENIELNIGTMAGIELSALKTALQQVMIEYDVRCENISYQLIEAKAYCSSCKRFFQPEAFMAYCTLCGNPQTEVTQGKELKIQSITFND